MVNINSSEAASKVAEDKQPQASVDTSQKITHAIIIDELKKVKTTASAVNGNRYIIMLRKNEDPLTFKSNVEFKRYLGITGRRQGEVAKEYGPQQVAGKYIIHVPK